MTGRIWKVIQRMVYKLPDSGPVSAHGEGPEPGVSGCRAACARLDPRIGATSRAPQAGIRATRPQGSVGVLVLGHDGVPTGLSVDGENQGAREFGVGRPELGW